MKNYLKILMVVGLINLYPFGCEGQTIIDPDCNDIVSEQWEAERKQWASDEADFISTIEGLTQENRKLTDDLTGLQLVITNKDTQIEELQTANGSLSAHIDVLEGEKSQLQILLDECKATVQDTVVVESEYITVNGTEYKVSDIELIRPIQTVDTIRIAFCQDTTGLRDFWHEGPIDQYPHFINIATKTLGMKKVYFETPLDSTIKVADEWEVLRIRNYELARTQYNFIRAIKN